MFKAFQSTSVSCLEPFSTSSSCFQYRQRGLSREVQCSISAVSACLQHYYISLSAPLIVWLSMIQMGITPECSDSREEKWILMPHGRTNWCCFRKKWEDEALIFQPQKVSSCLKYQNTFCTFVTTRPPQNARPVKPPQYNAYYNSYQVYACARASRTCMVWWYFHSCAILNFTDGVPRRKLLMLAAKSPCFSILLCFLRSSVSLSLCL